METVKKVDYYTLRFVNGDTIVVPAEILIPYFRTLVFMIEDFPLEENVEKIIIPLPNYVEKSIIQWIIDAYVFYTMLIPYHDAPTLNQLYEEALALNTILQLFDPFAQLKLSLDNKLDEKVGLDQLVEIIDTLNWLDARELLLLSVDHLYKMLEKMTSQELALLIEPEESTTKRVREEEEMIELPLTPHYKHNLLIQKVLRQKLPADLILADKAIPKYITPFSYDDKVFYFLKAMGLYRYRFLDTLEASNVKLLKVSGLPGTPLSIVSHLRRTMYLTTEGLYRESTERWSKIELEGEVLALAQGFRHNAVLTTDGLYISMDDLVSFHRIEIDDRILSIYGVDRGLFIITTKAINKMIFTGKEQIQFELGQEQVVPFITLDQIKGNILSFAAGREHQMIVTDEGLFALGINHRGQFGLPKTGRYPTFELTRVENLSGKPLFVYCGSYYTVLLTTDGLFAAGQNLSGQLSVPSIVQGLDVESFTKMVGLEGQVKSVLCESTFVLVLTTMGVYISGILYNMVDRVEDRLTSRLFRRLPIEMGYFFSTPSQLSVEEEEEDEKNRKRKQRRLQCLNCYGDASFLANQHHIPNATFCSKICLYRSQLQ